MGGTGGLVSPGYKSTRTLRSLGILEEFCQFLKLFYTLPITSLFFVVIR